MSDTHLEARGVELSGDPDGGLDGDDAIGIELLPLDAWHRAHGARMVPFAGYEMPIQYDGIMAEHLWTRDSAGLFDVSHMGQLFLSGDGLDDALETLIPADVRGIKPNAQKYSLLLDEGGGILDDLMLTRWADGLYMVVNGAVKYDDIGHLRTELPDDITLNHMDDQALLALQGPKAVAALARVVPGVERLVFLTGERFDWNGTALWISRSGYTGEDGFEISVPADAAAALADALVAQPEVKPIGLGARDSLRLEADLPLYGHDLDADTTPIMAALNFAVGSKRRREEANFPGAARILAERENGAIARRVGLIIEGRQPVREGAAVIGDGETTVGKVTSGGFRADARQPDRDGLCSDRDGGDRHQGADRPARQDPYRHRDRDAIRSPPLRPIEEASEMSRYFTEDHEWVDVDGEIGTVGISDYAQGQLGDIVFVDVPEEGKSLTKGDEAAVVESVKAASDVYSPVSGTVIEGNAALADEPALVNNDAEGDGWFYKIGLSDSGELDELMDEAAYEAFVAKL